MKALAALLCASLLAPQTEPRADVERELTVRDRARALWSGEPDPAAQGSAAPWPARWARLEAEVRAAALAPRPLDLEVLGGALDDPQPNLRAAALARLATAVHDVPPERLAAAADAAARELLPELRLAALELRAAALGAGVDLPGTREALLAATTDGDPEVARRALRTWPWAAEAGDGVTYGALLLRAAERDAALPFEALAVLDPWFAGPQLVALVSELPPRFAGVGAALAALAGEDLDAAALVEHWPRELNVGAPVDGLLWRALAAIDPGERRELAEAAASARRGDLLQALVFAGGARAVLEALDAAEGERALTLLAALDDADLRLEAADVQRLLARPELRSAAVSALAAAAVAGDPGTAAGLATALPALPAELAQEVLRLLDPATLAGHAEAVAAAFERAGEPLSWVSFLPHDRPLAPLRPALLRLAQDPRARPALVPLLAQFEGDGEVGRRLAQWFDEECAAEPVDGEALAALAAALAQQSGEDAAPSLARALARHEEGPLGLLLVRLLGRTATGRRALALELEQGRGLPLDARAEALALLLAAGEAPASAPAELLAGLEQLAAESERRVLAAYSAVADAPAVAALARRLSSEPATDLRQRLIAALADCGAAARGALAAHFPREPEFEVRVDLVRALGRLGAVGELADLHHWVAGAEVGDPAAEFAPLGVDEARGLLLEELAIELARLDEPQLEPGGGFLARLVAAATEDLGQRFDRAAVGAVDFRWRAELATAAALSRAGELEAALARSGPWWRGDGRALLGLCQAATGHGPARRALAAAATIALSGEGPPAAVWCGLARQRLLSLTVEAGHWAEVEPLAQALLRDYASGALPDRAFLQAFGNPDPARGHDPLAELQALCGQARGQRALADGDLAAAAAAAQAARAVLRSSRAAHTRQDTLEAQLADAQRR